ncbi:MAG: histidine kinase [Trebouxia sp. A1-2]|nr:MAG: histidine kinase [Trebouxia sp. A1-2]
MTKESKENAEQRSGISVPSRHRELQGFHKVLYDAVGELSPGLSEEAFSTLCSDAKSLELSQITLNFRDAGTSVNSVEAEFQQHVAVRRRPILLLVFCFDVICYLFRMAAKFVRTNIMLAELMRGIFPQLCNMMLLYTFLGLLNRRSRRLGDSAARQEEYMLTGIMTLAICSLLATINESNPQDYVYAAMFMISTTCFLKIQWLVGTSFMMLPLAVTHFWHKNANVLPTDAMVHLIVSWAVGGFMAYLSDTYRRQMFVNHRLAKVAAEKELQEAQARINVQQQLATAQAQAAQRAISVAREKAANEAKSEFMSLMCHEVRTPLNGCLASAEMLLEMPLQEEQRELAKTIRVSGSILLSTVSNFLDFFKMEAGKQLDVVRTEIRTKELVGDIHCIIEATIGRSSEVQLEKPNTNGVPDYVLGDPDRLRGILLNLYTNAAKFTRKGSIALRLRLASKDYRPCPAQVIAQQERGGPAAARHGLQTGSGQNESGSGPKPSKVAWGTINVASSHTGSHSRRQSVAARQLSQTGSSPACKPAAAEAAASNPTQAQVEGPGAKAATDAFTAVQRGQDAHNAAEAINHQVYGLTTPVAAEHIAGHALLQRTVSVIDKAADKMQRDAGKSLVGHDQAQAKLGCMMLQSDPLHAVKQDCSSSAQCQEGATEPPLTQSRDTHQEAQSFLSEHAAQSLLVDAELIKRGSTSVRRSSSSVLDQPDESSSSGGSSTPSRAEPEDQAESLQDQSQRDSAERQEAGLEPSTMRADAPVSSQTAQKERRLSGTPRSAIGERTRSSSDVTESDVSFRHSNGSFSDYPPPMRKSFSSPVDSLTQAADEAAAAHQAAGVTATSYNGMSGGKSTAGKSVTTSVQDLGDGWFNTVAQGKTCVRQGTRSAGSSSHKEGCVAAAQSNTDRLIQSLQQSPFSQAPSPTDPAVPAAESDQWLVFEVTDTGCGISQRGLASLFTEYVQGTEDDMKRPRTRGGTGLGLSICSKQVSVLGGSLGAMSKLGEGSTFWFTIPLLRPTQTQPRESISMRRTASWGSRDAFSDGHISRHADDPVVPQGRRIQAATTKAHRHKHAHPLVRSANYQAMHQQQPAELGRRPSLSVSDNDSSIFQRPLPSQEAARRMSAPEHPPGKNQLTLCRRRDEKQRFGMRTANSDDTSLQSQDLGQPTARAAVARAVLCAKSPQHKGSNEPSQQQLGSSSDKLNGIAGQQSQSAHEKQSHRQLNGHSHGKDGLQRNLLAQYEGARPAAATAVDQADRDGFAGGQSLEALPEGTSLAFQAPGAHQRPSDSQISVRQGKGASVSSPSGPLNIRSSMEARWRRLGLSALQGRMVLLAEDNLINQRVAKMMLSSLGMTVEVVSNGQEAVDAVKRRVGQDGVRQFDVLLMDMAMPVMGGVDATKEIRRSGAVVPIVAMTANSSDKDRDECLESGMDGFLSKPVLKDRLAEAILTAVSGRRQFQDRSTISLKAYDQL